MSILLNDDSLICFPIHTLEVYRHNFHKYDEQEPRCLFRRQSLVLSRTIQKALTTAHHTPVRYEGASFCMKGHEA